MGVEDLWIVCHNLCEIADQGVADERLGALDAVAYQLPFLFAELRSRLG
jgi:hypothetical protein